MCYMYYFCCLIVCKAKNVLHYLSRRDFYSENNPTGSRALNFHACLTHKQEVIFNQIQLSLVQFLREIRLIPYVQ